MTFVFQYGSNTNELRINAPDRLIGDAGFCFIAETEDDYEFEFTIYSRTNKCAAANIFPGHGRKIWGVVYQVPDYLIKRQTSQGRKSLDAIEGEGKNYERVFIKLRHGDGTPVESTVITYLGKKRMKEIKTSFEYASKIIEGLRSHNIQNEYIDYIKNKIIENNIDLKNEIEAL